jgi:hypothetical protein
VRKYSSGTLVQEVQNIRLCRRELYALPHMCMKWSWGTGGNVFSRSRWDGVMVGLVLIRIFFG